MKIYIPFQKKDIGGPSSFVKKFALGMTEKGHYVVFEECADYDILFVIVQAPFSVLWRAKKSGRPIVQRLDGVYYWAVSGWKFPLLNLKAALTRHFFADYTVYQSAYSKFCVEKFLGKKKEERQTIIYNGVDTHHFSPIGPKKNLRNSPREFIFFTASEFRRRDQIIPMLSALERLAERTKITFKLVLAGQFIRELSHFENTLKEYPWVQFLGKIPNEELPQYERGSDLFLFCHNNPPCPNNVIEAMSSGLPIVGIADGSMPELVQNDSEGLLLSSSGNAFWKRRVIDTNTLSHLIEEAIAKKEALSPIARQTALERFSLEKMIGEYEKVFLDLMN